MSMVLADRDIGRDVARGSGRGSGLEAGREVRRREWRMRIERFRASGISIVAFCARENVSVASYYYWTRLLREEVAGQLNDRMETAGSVIARGTALDSCGMQSHTRGTNSEPATAVVRFLLSSGAEILVPAEQVDLIHSLARCLISESASSAKARAVKPATDLAFREVVVTS